MKRSAICYKGTDGHRFEGGHCGRARNHPLARA